MIRRSYIEDWNQQALLFFQQVGNFLTKANKIDEYIAYKVVEKVFKEICRKIKSKNIEKWIVKEFYLFLTEETDPEFMNFSSIMSWKFKIVDSNNHIKYINVKFTRNDFSYHEDNYDIKIRKKI